MRKYQYNYNIHKENSPKIFKSTCEKIEAYLLGAEKNELLVDVDGSTIQVFSYGNNKETVVYDDYGRWRR